MAISKRRYIRMLTAYFCFVSAFILVCSANASELAEQRLVFQSTKNNTEYRLTLSALKNVNATVVAEREVVVSGELTRDTFEFTSGLKPFEAWALLERELTLSTFRELFSCDGLSCGSSNAWANNRFEIKQLYGLDQTQKYRVYSNESETVVEYYAVYFVQRGNKRIYAQVDKITTQNSTQKIAESPSTIISLIEKNGYYAVQFENENKLNDQQIRLLAQALKNNPLTRYYVVGHCAMSVEHQKNLLCAKQGAEKILSMLVDFGVPERRMEVQAIGSLAPRIKMNSERVELVTMGVTR